MFLQIEKIVFLCCDCKSCCLTSVLIFPQLLVPLVSSFRYDGDEVNMTLAKSEAKILHETISDKAYTHEELIRILTTRSKAQLNATLNHYNNEFGNAINKVCASP